MWRHGYICGLLLCSFGLLAQARFEQADPTIYPQSAEIGKVGFVIYEEFQEGDLPDHICSSNDCNCTTPHGQCSDDHDKYQLVVIADPVTELGGHTWFCGIQIEGMSLNDVGVYKICKLVGGAQEHQDLHINFAAWEIDSHGRTCQTSYDETSKELVNNCTSLTTTPQLTTTGIFSVREILTAWVGDNVNIPFGYCSLPRPSCTLTQSFKLSSPNPTCKLDHYEHCEIARAPDNDPHREGMDSVCELCVLVVHGVTESDTGPYAICQTSSSGPCTSSSWLKISTLKVEEKETVSLTTEAVEPISMLFTKYTEKVGSNDDDLNEKREHQARYFPLTFTSVFTAALVVVIVIWAILGFRKRCKISTFHDHTGYQTALSEDPLQPAKDV